MLGPEKGLFLRGLVEQARPGFVVGCGTALGYSGFHVLTALQSIGKGMLLTVEIDPIRAREALIAADNAGIGGPAMVDYLGCVLSRFTSELRWFETALPFSRSRRHGSDRVQKNP
jgi:predicted O-methyltransferase YrrM